jgi:hypothetical protein
MPAADALALLRGIIVGVAGAGHYTSSEVL